MINSSSLTTIALLAAFAENNDSHYLDLLLPFVLYCLPEKIGETVDLQEVRENLEKNVMFQVCLTQLLRQS